MQSIATAVASRAAMILDRGTSIDPDVSTITISAAVGRRSPRPGEAGGAHGHDRVDLGAAGRQVLVLEDLDLEFAHRLRSYWTSMTATVMLSLPPRARAMSVSARPTAAGEAPAGSAAISSASSGAVAM